MRSRQFIDDYSRPYSSPGIAAARAFQVIGFAGQVSGWQALPALLTPPRPGTHAARQFSSCSLLPALFSSAGFASAGCLRWPFEAAAPPAGWHRGKWRCGRRFALFPGNSLAHHHSAIDRLPPRRVCRARQVALLTAEHRAQARLPGSIYYAGVRLIAAAGPGRVIYGSPPPGRRGVGRAWAWRAGAGVRRVGPASGPARRGGNGGAASAAGRRAPAATGIARSGVPVVCVSRASGLRQLLCFTLIAAATMAHIGPALPGCAPDNIRHAAGRLFRPGRIGRLRTALRLPGLSFYSIPTP